MPSDAPSMSSPAGEPVHDQASAPWGRIGDDPLRDATPGGEEFTDLAALAARLFDAPIAVLTLGHGPALRLVTQQGLADAGAALQSSAMLRTLGPDTPRLHLDDAATDPAFGDDPLVAGSAGMRFVFASTVVDASGACLGTLTVADTAARQALPPGSDRTMAHLCRLAARLLERHQLLRRNRIAAQIIQSGFSAVVVVDGHGTVAFVNRRAETLFGSRVRAMRGMPLEVLFPAHLQPDPAAVQAWLAHPTTASDEHFHLHIRDEYGQLRTLDATRCAWRVGDGQGMALVIRDITEQLEQQENLRRIALVDAQTGLPNRNALGDVLNAQVDSGTGALGLALLGLDNFQTINDTLGPTTGGGVLRTAAERLRAALPEAATLARFGDDEFALVYPDADADALDQHLDRLLQVLAQPCEVDGHMIVLDASIGLALRSDGDDDEPCDGDNLIACADLALYRARASGGRRWRRFDPGMRREVIDRRMLDLELRRAHAQGEFELHYQPQIDLGSGLTFGAEALLRWRHPERGLLSPAVFIEALAASPVAAEVGRWILQQACRDAARWPRIGGRAVAISVNLFPVQVNEGRLQAEIDQALASTGLPAERLELEITETIALRPGDTAACTLAGLRERGVRLAFDDFGTGYASLSMLQRFPIDRVKIDRSFVRDMLDNHGDAAIVRSILLISSNLQLQVIAEGVENPDQADLLRGLGCQGAQGFLYAPALAPEQFDRWLAAQAADPAVLPWQLQEVAGHA